MTLEKAENKITITYFDGDSSEWFMAFNKNKTNDGRDPLDRMFELLVNHLNEYFKSYVITIGKETLAATQGKHFWKT